MMMGDRVIQVGRPAAAWGLAALLLGCLCGTGGCTDGQPRARLGSLPFPGLFSLYCTADAKRLGVHRYSQFWMRLGEQGEDCDRGTLYTCRGGFLDVSHLRESADWVRYLDEMMRQCLEGKRASFTFTKSDGTFTYRVARPAWLDELDEPQRREAIQTAALRFAQRASVVVCTWHEVATWYGQETIPLVSERGSAFTWDDTTSHVVGAIVGGRAMRAIRTQQPTGAATDDAWDQAVTRELDAMIEDELGAVSIGWMREAIQAMHGRWWSGVQAVRRDLQTGLESGRKHPWRVQGLPCCDGAEEAELLVPDLRSIAGHDMTAAVTMELAPAGWLMHKVMACDQCPRAITSEEELLGVIERMRLEMKAAWGDDADRP